MVPIPSQSSDTVVDPLAYPLATRWPRFLARTFDLWWEGPVVGFVAALALTRYAPGIWKDLTGMDWNILFGMLCLPIALMLDALVYGVLGNTPGKALLGLHVTRFNGERLGLLQYLGRNLELWEAGLALGIPIVTLFTMARQSSRLVKGKQASYDETTGFRVRQGSCGWARKTCFGIACLALVAAYGAFQYAGQQIREQQTLPQTYHKYSWENPATHLSAEISSGWKYSQETNKQGEEIYLFTDRNGRAIVILGREHWTNATLQDYVDAFTDHVAGTLKFSDGGRFFQTDGRPFWEAKGRVIENKDNRLDVQIMQRGSAFWRIVVVQVPPLTSDSQVSVRRLRKALWKTVALAQSREP